MKKLQRSKESDWKKVGPCLYRYRGGRYYALLKQAGKQIRRSLETQDLALARRRLADLRKEFESTDPQLASRTLEMHRERFESALAGAASTMRNEQHSLKLLVEEWPKDSPRVLSKIRKADCQKWIAQYDLSASTINHRITTLRRFFDMAVDDRVISSNPAHGIKYRKPAREKRPTPTLAQFQAIVADLRSQARNPHGSLDSADFVELAGTLGLGQAELTGIQRKHIDLATGTICIFRKKTKQGFLIPVYPSSQAIIKRRLEGMPEDADARLLPHDNCKKALAGSCKRLNFPNFEPRSLRRMFITTALRAGVDVATVAAWQGHRDGGALVLKTYGDEVRLDHSLKMAMLLVEDEKQGSQDAGSMAWANPRYPHKMDGAG
jgi:integrase